MAPLSVLRAIMRRTAVTRRKWSSTLRHSASFGLETELALSMELVRQKVLTLPQLIGKFTVGPARLLRLNRGTLSVGADADITIIYPGSEWIYDVAQSASKARNSPFHGWKFQGRAITTIVGGRVVWRDETK
jgi:dihydroorotase